MTGWPLSIVASLRGSCPMPFLSPWGPSLMFGPFLLWSLPPCLQSHKRFKHSHVKQGISLNLDFSQKHMKESFLFFRQSCCQRCVSCAYCMYIPTCYNRKHETQTVEQVQHDGHSSQMYWKLDYGFKIRQHWEIGRIEREDT